MDAAVHERLASIVGATPVDARPLSGGEIGDVDRVDLDDGRTVVAKRGPTPLDREAAMLTHLATESPLPVPEVCHADASLLALEHVEGESSFSPAAERHAAELLASLHDVSAPVFGFEFDTFTGQLEQPNERSDSWIEFFRDRRIRHAAARAHRSGALPAAVHERVEALAADLGRWLVEPSRPSLLHGDVWTANVLSRDDTIVAFLDPATYYGHAEVEPAYVRWSDTFGDPFFDRYGALRPIDDGFWGARRHLYALYPALVHVWHFGNAYLESVEGILERFDY